MILAVLVVVSTLRATPAVGLRPTQGCLHEAPGETAEQRGRRVEAVQFTRLVLSVEAQLAAHSPTGAYPDLSQLNASPDMRRLPASGEYVPGFELHLDATDKGFWLEFVDKTDPCGFRFISNQAGVIFTAEPIR